MNGVRHHNLITLRQSKMILALIKLSIGIIFLYFKIKKVISKIRK